MENLPQYRKLYELLRKQILAGIYEEGSLIPSENNLCVIHGMARPTVRHALDSLVKDGLIVKKQGKGSIVRKPPQNIGILSIAGTASAIGEHYLKTDIIRKPRAKKWPENFAFDLDENEVKAGCIYMERLRFVENKPVFYDINHLPNIDLPYFTRRSFENKSLFGILQKHYNIKIIGGEQKLRAIIPGKKIREVLKLNKGNPVLHIERKLYTDREGYNIYSTIYFNSEKHLIYGVF
jgi:DNA-binding GntR family transcriptional regulator